MSKKYFCYYSTILYEKLTVFLPAQTLLKPIEPEPPLLEEQELKPSLKQIFIPDLVSEPEPESQVSVPTIWKHTSRSNGPLETLAAAQGTNNGFEESVVASSRGHTLIVYVGLGLEEPLQSHSTFPERFV